MSDIFLNITNTSSRTSGDYYDFTFNFPKMFPEALYKNYYLILENLTIIRDVATQDVGDIEIRMSGLNLVNKYEEDGSQSIVLTRRAFEEANGLIQSGSREYIGKITNISNKFRFTLYDWNESIIDLDLLVAFVLRFKPIKE